MHVPKTRYISRATWFPFLYKLNADDRSVLRLTWIYMLSRHRCWFWKNYSAYLSLILIHMTITGKSLGYICGIINSFIRLLSNMKETSEKRDAIGYRRKSYFRKYFNISAGKEKIHARARAHTLVYGMEGYFYLPKHEDSNMRRGAQKCQRKSASTIWYALKNLGALWSLYTRIRMWFNRYVSDENICGIFIWSIQDEASSISRASHEIYSGIFHRFSNFNIIEHTMWI